MIGLLACWVPDSDSDILEARAEPPTATIQTEKSAVPDSDILGQVPIPAGRLALGPPLSDPPDPRDIAAFTITSHPVTVQQFMAAAPPSQGDVAWRTHDQDPRCNAGAEGREQHPMNCVNWYAARAFCQAQGARLPTEAEWEHAARAGTSTTYWWGDGWEDGRAVTCTDDCEQTAPVATEGPRCNAWGVCDVTGNVWEWTLTTWGADPHSADEPDPAATTGLMRGGAATAKAGDPVLTVGYRSDLNLQNANFYMGFRCVFSGS